MVKLSCALRGLWEEECGSGDWGPKGSPEHRALGFSWWGKQQGRGYGPGMQPAQAWAVCRGGFRRVTCWEVGLALRKNAKQGGGKQDRDMSSQDQKLGPDCLSQGCPPHRVSLRPREGENVGLGRRVTHPRQGPEPFLRSCPRGTTPSLLHPVPTLYIAGLLRGERDPPSPSHRKPLVSSD